MAPPNRENPKHSVGFSKQLWQDLEHEKMRGTAASITALVNQGARFRVNYAAAARKANSTDPAKIFAADHRLLQDLQRWANRNGP